MKINFLTLNFFSIIGGIKTLHQHSMSNKILFHSILDEHKLEGENFNDWYYHLMIVLRLEQIAYILDKPIPPKPNENASQAIIDAWKKHINDNKQAVNIMLGSISNELQKSHMEMDAHSIILQLKKLLDTSVHNKKFQTSSALYRTKYTGGSIGEHLLTMVGYILKLANLGFTMKNETIGDIILNSLP